MRWAASAGMAPMTGGPRLMTVTEPKIYVIAVVKRDAHVTVSLNDCNPGSPR